MSTESTKPAESPKPEPTTERWVCAGERWGILNSSPKPQLYSEWFKLDEKGKPEGTALIFSKLKAWPCSVREVKVLRSGDGVSVVSSSHVDDFKDEARRLEWRALQDAARTAKQAAADENKSREANAYEALEPLHRAYRQAPPLGKQVIIAKAIQYIMRGGA